MCSVHAYSYELLAVVLQKAVCVLKTSVAEVVLALMTIPGRVIPPLVVSTPAIPAPATDHFPCGLICAFHWEVEQGEVCWRSWVSVVTFLRMKVTHQTFSQV